MKKALIAWFVLVVLLEACLLFAQVPGTGFSLRGLLTFGGYVDAKPIWVMGKGFSIIAVDPSLNRQLIALEGREIIVEVSVAPPRRIVQKQLSHDSYSIWVDDECFGRCGGTDLPKWAFKP